MKKQKFLSLIILSSVIATLHPITTLGEEINFNKKETSIEKIDQSNSSNTNTINSVTSFGFLSYLYKDDNFSNLESIKFNVNSNKLIDSKNIKSAKFIAQIKPSETKSYQFSTTNNENCILKVNDQILINKELNSKPIKLNKDQLYSIELEASGNLTDFELFLLDSNLNKESIKKENILLPNPSNKSTPIIKFAPSLYTSVPGTSPDAGDGNINQNKDNDNDGIPNEWELSGYTFKDNQIIKWSNDLESKGYNKYVSNPNKARTSNDPYTDMQKVIGQMPSTTKFEARDPMIPAVPIISVGMEKLLISKNENVSSGSSGTKTINTGKTDSTSHAVAAKGGIQINSQGLSFSFSPEYTHTSVTTTTVNNTDSKTWSEALNLNTADSAYLNANIRYYNTGTAPVYELRPTTNFVLQNSKSTIATIRSGPNQIGNSLVPGKTYPEKNSSPIALNTANELGMTKIAINSDVLNNLQNGTDNIKLETTQFSGQYGTIDSNGHLITSSANTWAPIRSEIEETSANIIMKTSDSIQERFISTKSPQDLNDRTPVLTIKEALKKAYNLSEKNGSLYYLDESTNKEYLISEKTITVIFDQSTFTRINELLKKSPNKSLFDLSLERGMKMTITLPEFYDNMTPSMWSGYSYSSGNGLGVLGRNTLTLNQKLTIKKGFDYLINFSHNSSTMNYTFVVKFTDNKTGKSIEKIVKSNSSNCQVIIPSTYIDSDNVSLSIYNDNGFNISFTDFKITQLKSSDVIEGIKKISYKYNNGKVLTGDTASNNVIMSPSNAGNNQKWKFEYKSDKGAYLIKNMHNNSLLTWKKNTEDNVELVNSNEISDNQYWVLENHEDEYYRFKNYQDPTRYLYASPYSDNVAVAGAVSNIDQQFKITD